MLDTGSNPSELLNIECETIFWLAVFATQCEASAANSEVEVVAVIVRWLIMRLIWFVVKPLHRQRHHHHHSEVI